MKTKLLVCFTIVLLFVPMALLAGGEKEAAREEIITLSFFTQEPGAFENLNPYLEADGAKWEKEFYSNALDLMRVEGKVYAIPVSLNNLQVMLNRGLLEEHGL